MTNKEAVKAFIGFNIPDEVIEAQAQLIGLDLTAEYDKKDRKKIVYFTANLLLYVAQTPQTIREIDWSITNRSVEEIMSIRKYLLASNGIKDTLLQPKISSKPWW